MASIHNDNVSWLRRGDQYDIGLLLICMSILLLEYWCGGISSMVNDHHFSSLVAVWQLPVMLVMPYKPLLLIELWTFLKKQSLIFSRAPSILGIQILSKLSGLSCGETCSLCTILRTLWYNDFRKIKLFETRCHKQVATISSCRGLGVYRSVPTHLDERQTHHWFFW